jgi:hypothetical protein
MNHPGFNLSGAIHVEQAISPIPANEFRKRVECGATTPHSTRFEAT